MSFKLIEQPARHWQLGSVKRTLVYVFVVPVLLVSFLSLLVFSGVTLPSFCAAEGISNGTQPKRLYLSPPQGIYPKDSLAPVSGTGTLGCSLESVAQMDSRCKKWALGVKDPTTFPDVLFIGDSHLISSEGIFHYWARALNASFFSHPLAGCTPVPGIRTHFLPFLKSCEEIQKNWRHLAMLKNIRCVVMVSRWGMYAGRGNITTAKFVEELRAFVKELLALHKTVVLVGSTPELPGFKNCPDQIRANIRYEDDVRTAPCVATYPFLGSQVGTDFTHFVPLNHEVEDLALLPNVHYFSFHPLLCSNDGAMCRGYNEFGMVS